MTTAVPSPTDLVEPATEPDAVERRPSLRRGASRLAAGQVFQVGVRLGSAVVLARLLEPRHFGLIGLVNILTFLLQRTLGDSGMINALVQRRDLSTRLTSTVFWFNISVGVTTAAFLMAFAPWIAALLGDRAATGVVRGMSVIFIIGAAARVPTALLRREMKYSRIALVGSANAAVSAIVAIAMAAAGHGVSSLVAAQIASTIAAVVITWIFARWRPTLTFSRADLRSVTSFARNLTAFNLVNYFADAGDKFIVGRFVGTAELGLYTLPYRIVFLPVFAIAQVYRELLFPVFSRNQDDDHEIARAYLRAVGAMSLVTFPLCAGIAALAGPLVDASLGEKWHEAGPIVSVMSVVALQQSVLVTGSIILTAKGRTDILLKWGVVAGGVLFGFYGVGAIWGAMGVAVGFLAGTTVLAYPAMALPFRQLSLPFPQLLRALRPAFVATALLTAGAVVTRVLTESAGYTPAGVVGASGTVGALLYAGSLLLTRPTALADLLGMIRPGRSL